MSTEDPPDDKTTPFMRDGEPVGPTPATPAAGAPARSAMDPYRSAGVVADRKPGGSMFGNFAAAKNRKAPKWAAPLLIGISAVVVGAIGVMLIVSIWEIEMLERPKTKYELAVAPPPPPPPPPPPGGAKPVTPQIVPKKMKVKDIVQPVKIEKQEITPVENSGPAGDPDGEEGGEEGGVAGGVVGGVGGSPPPPPPPPPPPAPPQNVPPTLLEGSRIAGDKMIVPDDVTKTEIQRSGKDKIIGSFKLCINASGAVTSVKMLKSSGFPAYDSKIQSKMNGEWKYRPYAVNGRAVPVCTAVTFIYSQK
ncbi:MAG: energy transducer TonB [Deltaproteobacteria bacterium]|nr:energy transducer TonB [Deltaproteobacteria bacterium]